jgi:hypothetical protein
VEVYENICEDNWQGIAALHVYRGVGSNLGAWEVRNLRVHRNEVRTTNAESGQGRSGLVADSASPVFYRMGNRFDANKYNVPSCSGHYFLWQGADRTWTQWQQGFSQDVAGGCN